MATIYRAGRRTEINADLLFKTLSTSPNIRKPVNFSFLIYLKRLGTFTSTPTTCRGRPRRG